MELEKNEDALLKVVSFQPLWKPPQVLLHLIGQYWDARPSLSQSPARGGTDKDQSELSLALEAVGGVAVGGAARAVCPAPVLSGRDGSGGWKTGWGALFSLEDALEIWFMLSPWSIPWEAICHPTGQLRAPWHSTSKVANQVLNLEANEAGVGDQATINKVAAELGESHRSRLRGHAVLT